MAAESLLIAAVIPAVVIGGLAAICLLTVCNPFRVRVDAVPSEQQGPVAIPGDGVGIPAGGEMQVVGGEEMPVVTVGQQVVGSGEMQVVAVNPTAPSSSPFIASPAESYLLELPEFTGFFLLLSGIALVNYPLIVNLINSDLKR